ncbi:MAG: polysaccharide deacetylase family protein [Clostridia bacterium]|nr:polysaccharide deacetylase family protein [Clostridia bacterium]
MFKILHNLFRDGTRGAVTMSFDDACVQDERLVKIFDTYGIKGTFNINSGRVHPNAIHVSRAIDVYKSHEIACHGYYHLDPTAITSAQFGADVFRDRQEIEKCTGRVIEGFAYPFGAYNDMSEGVLSSIGIKYARTVEDTLRFDLIPDNFLKWRPTCHQSKAQDYVDAFAKRVDAFTRNLTLFYIWGHGFEFKTEEDWTRIEEVCKRLSSIEGVWFATNMEIYDYIQALRNLRYSIDNALVLNPSSTDVWVSVIDPVADRDYRYPVAVKIPSGQQVDLRVAYQAGR